MKYLAVLLIGLMLSGCGAYGKVGGDVLGKENSIEGGYDILKDKQ